MTKLVDISYSGLIDTLNYISVNIQALEKRLTDLEKNLNDLADRVTENGG